MSIEASSGSNDRLNTLREMSEDPSMSTEGTAFLAEVIATEQVNREEDRGFSNVQIEGARELVALHSELSDHPGAVEFDQYLVRQKALIDTRSAKLAVVNSFQVEQRIGFIQQLFRRTGSLVEETTHLLSNRLAYIRRPMVEVQGGMGLFMFGGPISVILGLGADLPSEVIPYIATSLTASGFYMLADGALREGIGISLYRALREVYCDKSQPQRY